MMRGYKCKHKTAQEILEILGFDSTLAIRGWVMERTGGKTNQEAPIRMHAIVQSDDEGEYIDLHADHHGPNDTHITVRGRRIARWKQIFEQIDHSKECDAGHKLLAHYGALREALDIYHAKRETNFN